MNGIAELEGVGSSAERKLEQIAPLVEYYEREMGVGAGRLMLATNFLRDARLMQPGLRPETRVALEQAETLVVSVMIRFLNAQKDADPNLENPNDHLCDPIEQLLSRIELSRIELSRIELSRIERDGES